MSKNLATKKSLVNTSVLEVSKNADVYRSIEANLLSAENSAFKVAVKCLWLLGEAIPCGAGTITNKKPEKSREVVYTRIGKSKATLSRWIKAVRYVIENHLFDDFNAGVYPFSFDKIIMIFDNDLVTEERTFADLMALTVKGIEALYKTEEEQEQEQEEEQTEEEQEQTEEQEEEQEQEQVTFVYEGQTFAVGKNTLQEFIENYCDMV